MTPAAKPPRTPYIGLPTDELLKMRGRSRAHILRWPSRVTKVKDGRPEEVVWEYADVDVVCRYFRDRWRVAEVVSRPREESDGSE